ncbi:MAG: hypothetical protein DWQ07_02190 [Chloroflexi bacterium]|nr:MAG: hypothetical protein DWQ07_02190 [Chloroflexota bacterium]MBL1193692.1 hypothetical protein [Chloroflexota bacterium]NOH10984.1 polysaccharide deacetylase family protein [Chloroflexota bacterium]
MKELLKRTLFYGAGLFAWVGPLFELVRRFSGIDIFIPFYHIVSNDEVLHVKHLYRYKNVQQFEADLDFFQENYQPIRFQQLYDHVFDNKPLPKHPLLLTFDDGLREVYDVVVPILKAKGMPAVFFLCSGFIDNQALFHKHKASLILENSSYGEEKALGESLSSVKYSQHESLDVLAEKSGLSFQEYLDTQPLYMIRQQIAAILDDDLFAIGAHSIDHPEYPLIPLEEQIRQTRESTQFVRQTFDLDYSTFSMPFHDIDVSQDYFDAILGDDIVDISFGIEGTMQEDFDRNYHRHNMEGGSYPARNMAFVYYIVAILRRLLGTHRIRRSRLAV